MTEHLNEHELRLYRARALEPAELIRASSHLAECEACRTRAASAAVVRAWVGAMRLNLESEAQSPHLMYKEIEAYADDSLDDIGRTRVKDHVGGCEQCAMELREIEGLKREMEARVSQMQTGRRNGGSRPEAWLATGVRWLRYIPVRVWVPAVTMCAVVAVLLSYSLRNSTERVEKLLGQAYTENRGLEIRIPYARHAEVKQRLDASSDVSFRELPRAFRQATEIVASNLESKPDDPRWLLLQARLDLFQEHYQPALNTLDRIQSSQSKLAEYHLTRALALYLKANKESQLQLYATAADELSVALKMNPNDSVALFNRAIIYQDLGMLKSSLEDWKRFLTIEPDPDWANEGRTRLEEVARELKQQSGSPIVTKPMLTRAVPDELNLYIEQYQDAALGYWLAEGVRSTNGDIARALRQLAGLLKSRHSDFWLSDFLNAASSQEIVAIESLSAALRENAAGAYTAALRHSEASARMFSRTKNRPGEFRARYELVYALQRLLKGGECLARANLLARDLATTRYRWLQIQSGIERAICMNFVGDLAAAQRNVAGSQRSAQNAAFPILTLRSIGIRAVLQKDQGRYGEAWEENLRGLRMAALGRYPGTRLYQFYIEMGLCAEHERLWYTAEALEREAIAALGDDKNVTQRATAELVLANLLMSRHENARAKAELDEAAKLLKADSDPVVNVNRMAARINLAELQLHEKDAKAALANLQSAEPILPETEGYSISLTFRRLRGDAFLLLNKLDEAEADYRAAIAQAERSLQTLKIETERVPWLRETESAYRGLTKTLLARQKPEKALDVWEWFRNRSLDQGPSQGAPQTASSRPPVVFEHLEWMSPFPRVVYVVFDDGLQVWVVRQGGVESRWVPLVREEFETLTHGFEENCASPLSRLDEVNEQSARLYELMVRPILSSVDHSDYLAIELDNTLADLSMEAIRTPDGTYLGEHYSIVYSPGYIAEMSLRNAGSFDRLAVPVVVQPAAQGAVAGNDAVREIIRELFPRAKIFQTRGFSWLDVLRYTAKADILHVTAHGLRDGSGTALAISTPARDVVRAQDFSPRYLRHIQLAVLAACSTGVGGDNGLLETRNLVHPFLVAGVSNVIASHWNVNSEATARLMRALYTHLYDGEGAPRALYAARKEVMISWPHPYYWAGFNITGRMN